MLKEVTGMDFPFNPSQFSGQQDNEIEAWRYYVEQYLAGKDYNDLLSQTR